jgi:uncharacterized RDD family membrane protein YckC
VIGSAPPTENLAGHYAGAVTRATAYIADFFLAVFVYGLAITVSVFLWNLITRRDIAQPAEGSLVWLIGIVGWFAIYFGYCWAMAGKTPGMALLGIRIVRRDGSDLDPRHALVRLVFFPFSFLILGLGFVGIVVGRERRAWHDRAADTAVVYDWDARAARLRFLSRNPRR